jgi:TPR repeat protein
MSNINEPKFSLRDWVLNRAANEGFADAAPSNLPHASQLVSSQSQANPSNSDTSRTDISRADKRHADKPRASDDSSVERTQPAPSVQKSSAPAAQTLSSPATEKTLPRNVMSKSASLAAASSASPVSSHANMSQTEDIKSAKSVQGVVSLPTQGSAALKPESKQADHATTSNPTQQMQIVKLLKDLGSRLHNSEKEREILWRELDACRRLLSDIDDKASKSEKAYLSLETKLNSVTAEAQDDQKKLLSSSAWDEAQKSIEKKLSSLETTAGSAVLRLEDVISENQRLSKRLDQVAQDKARLLKKMEVMEETLLSTQETLKAKALVLLTDQALAHRSGQPSIPAFTHADQQRSQQDPASSTAPSTGPAQAHNASNNAASQMASVSAQNMESGFFQNGLLNILRRVRKSHLVMAGLLALGLLGGYALSQMSVSSLPWSKVPSIIDQKAAQNQQALSQMAAGQVSNPVSSSEDALMSQIATLANQIEPGALSNSASSSFDPALVTQIKDQENMARDAFAGSATMTPLDDRLKPDDSLPSMVKDIETKAFDGNPEAQHDLAAIYTAGHAGVKADYQKAAQWFEEAAHNGVNNAQYNLGVLYHQGLGVKKDLTKAMELYRVAAHANHPEAQYNLGIAYTEGEGAQKNPQIAAYYFTLAAAGGIVEAAYNLGLIHEKGLLGEVQPNEALFWYSLASDRGNTQAKEALQALKSELKMSSSEATQIVARMKEQRPNALLESPTSIQ